MVEFLRKYEKHGDKIQLNSHQQIYQFILSLYRAEVRCDVAIFKLTASAQSIFEKSMVLLIHMSPK